MALSVLLVLGLLAAAPDADPGEALAKYNARKDKTPETAAAQWKLAVWCEQNRLDAEAYAHYSAVVRLDPSRAAAWRKLGFKRQRDGRWLNDEQIAAEAEQAKADKEWAPVLRKAHRNVHRGKDQDAALADLAAIDDPRAVRAVYREFGAGGAKDQEIAIQVLGQIDSPLSSKVLALLSIYARTPDVRRRATETLRGREPEEYLPVLVNLMADPVKYEVRPVGGPGSPGVLFVEGERANVRRFYAAPTPFVRFQPGDIVSYDQNGLPAITRPLALASSTLIQHTGTKKTGETSTFADVEIADRISMTQLLVEGQRAAAASQLQLQADVAALDARNKAQTDFNELVIAAAKAASGKDHGRKPRDWRDAVAGMAAPYPKADPKARPKPTFDELAPPAYVPRLTGDLTFVRSTHTTVTPPDT
jgi:hypothetical protein